MKLTAEFVGPNIPTCCANCSHYRGEPSIDCALVNRCPSNASSSRPVWCPLEEPVTFKLRGADAGLRLSHDARRWLADNSAVVEALASGTWKAVPVKATEKMLDAGNDAQFASWARCVECPTHGREYVPDCEDCDKVPSLGPLIDCQAIDVFKAMLAAAPAVPEDE